MRWLLWKLDGLSEYDVRRPLTLTGTNLLGLVKHLSVWEARYFGEVFGRPFPEPKLRWDAGTDADDDLWAAEDETRADIVGRYRRAWEHSDATIQALAIDAPGLAAAFRHRHPAVQVTFREADFTDPTAGLRAGLADVAITLAPFDDTGISTRCSARGTCGC